MRLCLDQSWFSDLLLRLTDKALILKLEGVKRLSLAIKQI